MREFNDADRKKKRGRIELPDNPGNLSSDTLSRLEGAVKAAVKEGYVACPSGWKIAKDLGVSRLDVGAMVDKLGIRIAGCQLGCFAVDKTPRTDSATEPYGDEVARRVEVLHETDELTCSHIFALAHELNVKPLTVVGAANARHYKLRQCQLGCF
ncbi:MAG: hypothetical protein HZB55_23490 [Deltaproteobacteria bacterium]|nr:hypothetical protein [Deltaproteobacteria bacterium]